MKEDAITEAVFEYLENGGKLPADASKNPQTRFMFQTAMAKMTYQKSCLAIDDAGEAKSIAEKTSEEMVSYKEVVDTKVDALVDKVNVRLGIVGSIIVIANIALVVLG